MKNRKQRKRLQPVTIRFSESQWRRISRLAAQDQRSVAAWLRIKLDEALRAA